MKNRTIGSALLALALALGVTGCGGPTRYTTVGVGAAQGADIQIEVAEKEGAFEVKLNAKYLLPPNRVVPEAIHYAAWARVGDRPAVHLANLTYDAEDRLGTAVATTPHAAFLLLVTAEKVEAPIAPSTDIVIQQQVAVE